jgi:hypothetical protein
VVAVVVMPTKPRRFRELAVAVKWNVDLKTPDEWMADEFLWGHSEAPVGGLLRRKYLKSGSDEERMARLALVRVLRSERPLSSTLRKRLAELFDESTIGERRLVLQFRRKGKRPHHMANAQVANYVDRQIRQGVKTEAAVALAMEHYGLSRKAINDMRRKHKRTGNVTSTPRL